MIQITKKRLAFLVIVLAVAVLNNVIMLSMHSPIYYYRWPGIGINAIVSLVEFGAFELAIKKFKL